MNFDQLTRKQLVKLTFTLLGGAAAVAACSSSGTYGGSNGSGGTAGGGTGGSTSAGACLDPLPETQLPDSTGHTHTVTIPASDLNATADQTIDTTAVFGHMHAITLAVADLATLKAGGPVTVTSTSAGTPAHTHMYSVSCQPG